MTGARRNWHLLEERFIRGTILRIEEADMWGKQEIKLILDADAQEGGRRGGRDVRGRRA